MLESRDVQGWSFFRPTRISLEAIVSVKFEKPAGASAKRTDRQSHAVGGLHIPEKRFHGLARMPTPRHRGSIRIVRHQPLLHLALAFRSCAARLGHGVEVTLSELKLQFAFIAGFYFGEPSDSVHDPPAE
jgi:hypothetical protein